MKRQSVLVLAMVVRLNGDSIDNIFYINEGAGIILAPEPIPAPSTLMLGRISVGFITWLRRRRTI